MTTASFMDRDTGCGADGQNVRIFQNDAEVYQFLFATGSVDTYDFWLDIAVGDTVDYILDPRFEGGCDAFDLTAVITAAPVTTCIQPGPDYAPVSDDCDDADGANFPTNLEVCDGQDNDCDDDIDDADADLDLGTTLDWYLDGDGDTYGAPVPHVQACLIPSVDHVYDGTDCDDGDLCDVDGDGCVASAGACGGDDCADNCNGEVDETCADTGLEPPDPGSCGCAVGTNAGSLGLVWALLALIGVRRRGAPRVPRPGSR